jgi:hypothetical protein
MDDKAYYSFIEQTLHYFNRPHEQAVVTPVSSPAAWRGSEMPPLESMAYYLSGQERADILKAVSEAGALGKPTLELVAADFPLPALEEKFREWRQTLMGGLGFQLIRGVPLEQWSLAEAELFFWCFGLHLGRPGQQNPEGHLLGHVINTGAAKEDAAARLYKTAAKIDYHCDAADVVGLFCLRKAKAGGKSRIVSSVTVFNELLKRRPDLSARLFKPMLLDIRDRELNDAGSVLPIQPCCYAEGTLRTFYHADYFRSVTRHSHVAPLTALEQDLLNSYEAIAMEPELCLDMDLQPGDVQLLSNHSNLHARTNYEDYEDPARRRHLLRLWLSL